MVVMKCPVDGCQFQTSGHPTQIEMIFVNAHAKRHIQHVGETTAASTLSIDIRSFKSANIESILLNHLPASEDIFKLLPWKDLLQMRAVSSACRNAVNYYLGGVKTICDFKGQFKEVEFDALKVIVPYTKSLQTFRTIWLLDDEHIATLLTNNPKLHVLSLISQYYQFYRISNNVPMAFWLLTALQLDYIWDNEADNTRFLQSISYRCPNLLHLWLSSDRGNAVLNDISLSHFGRLYFLENLRLKHVTVSGRLNILLSSCRRLTRIEMIDCTIGVDTLTGVAQHCDQLKYFTVYPELRLSTDEDVDFCTEATNIFLANSKIQSFVLQCGTLDTIDEESLNVMTEHLENVKEFGFHNDGGFPEIGDSFDRFLCKFQNLSHLYISSYHISQEWLNLVATKCCNLEDLWLVENSPNDHPNGGSSEIDISHICNRNRKLRNIVVNLTRLITPESCRALTTLDLTRFVLYNLRDFTTNGPYIDEIYRMLSTRFDGVTREDYDDWVEITKEYKDTDEERSFLYYSC